MSAILTSIEQKSNVELLQEVAINLWHADEASSLDLGRALIAVRNEIDQHGEFTKWFTSNGMKKSRVYYCISRAEGKVDLHFSSNSAEWYTPPEVIERTVSVLGSIDLDPCCNPGEPAIPAKEVFRKEDDGLDHVWRGKVYMNPPYGEEISQWVKKLVTDYAFGITQEAIALVPARVDTQWFKYFRDFPICFISGRLKFSGHENAAPFPSAVVHLGKDHSRFLNSFSDLGDIWVRFRGEA